MPAPKDSHGGEVIGPTSFSPLWIAFVVIAGAAVVAGLVIDHHGKFGIDGAIGFYAWYGILTVVALLALSRLLGVLLGRPGDYYDH